MTTDTALLEEYSKQDYKYGFFTDIDVDQLPPGLDEGVIALLSEKKGEPRFMLDYRLKAFATWKGMREPKWAFVNYPEIDYQAISYYSAPKTAPKYQSLDEVDPKLLETYEKLG
ncbi:MAG: Fe-S cluster assembly protein SufB, partial [Bdellovibrionales bacterium]|nr:Fe-S cluster assembly protein SufB [Bdellovibrionales bacterium]